MIWFKIFKVICNCSTSGKLVKLDKIWFTHSHCFDWWQSKAFTYRWKTKASQFLYNQYFCLSVTGPVNEILSCTLYFLALSIILSWYFKSLIWPEISVNHCLLIAEWECIFFSSRLQRPSWTYFLLKSKEFPQVVKLHIVLPLHHCK
jgi:hypothetical protein